MAIYKVIKCGHIIKCYEYEKLPKPNVFNTGGRKKDIDSDIDTEEKKKNRKDVSHRRRNTLMDLIVTNFDETSLFITLTFSDDSIDDVTDINQANKELDKFIKRLVRKQPDFKAVGVIEFQDKNGRGAVHYHMISNYKLDKPYNFDVAKERHAAEHVLQSVWRNGFVDIQPISYVDHVGVYVTKYMAKDVYDERLVGRKAYFRRGKLKQPEIIKNPSRAWLETLEGMTPTFTSDYETEYQGKIKFREFNTKRWT